jgi:hypothetical protein
VPSFLYLVHTLLCTAFFTVHLGQAMGRRSAWRGTWMLGMALGIRWSRGRECLLQRRQLNTDTGIPCWQDVIINPSDISFGNEYSLFLFWDVHPSLGPMLLCALRFERHIPLFDPGPGPLLDLPWSLSTVSRAILIPSCSYCRPDGGYLSRLFQELPPGRTPRYTQASPD